MSYAKVRKLAKNYYKIEQFLFFYEDISKNKKFFLNRDFLGKDYKNFVKIIRYMKIYKSIFLKCLNKLPEGDAFIVREIYVKGKSLYAVAFENYISDSTAYRILKKFNFICFSDMKKVSRIVNPLLEELRDKT